MALATISLPAFTTAHSHVFQRAMRGLAQRPGPTGTDDFWTWRKAMYDLADAVDPERLYRIARVAYREIKRTGTLTVGEFHYLHHQPGGAPYGDRTILADAVIRAARDEGLRIALLRTIYARAGAGRPPEGAQRRFSDPDVELALRDAETIAARWRHDPHVTVGLAPHSVRAVPPAWLRPIADFARAHDWPLHMHVEEQPGEVDACLAETGKRPMELLADHGVLGPRFVAVHATHALPHEAKLLGDAGGYACINATTERDLGDGHPNVAALREHGVKICHGIDSWVMTDPFEEMRGVELGERLRTLRRVTERKDEPTLAERSWQSASHEGARAVGFADAGGTVEIDADAPSLALVDEAHRLDALVFSCGPSVVAGTTLDEHWGGTRRPAPPR